MWEGESILSQKVEGGVTEPANDVVEQKRAVGADMAPVYPRLIAENSLDVMAHLVLRSVHGHATVMTPPIDG